MMEPFSLVGKTAIVTGGCGILGRKFCHGLAKAGARVAIVDLDATACQVLADEIAEIFPVKTLGLACDITDPKAVTATVAEIAQTLNGIDILMNNAATKTDDLGAFLTCFEDYDLATWRAVMNVNIDAMFIMAQAVGKIMINQGRGGSIIQTSSIYGIMAPDKRIYEGSLYNGKPISTPAVYSASKAAVVGLTKYLAAYWAEHNIRTNTLTPGGVESGQNETFSKRYSARVPLNRMADGEDMVGAAIFLASDASSYITGQNIVIDGGLSAW